MKIDANVNIHNRFDIHIDNIETGEHREVVGYNIVLDQMYDRLCALSDYFNYISFGRGTGTPTPDRTALFDRIGSKSVENIEKIYSLPDSSWKQKIVLAPEEYVGETITEVGISYNSSEGYLVTHAILKDSEGQPIAITKTDTDVVTIYATVFFSLGSINPDVEFINVSYNIFYDRRNKLLNYLMEEGYQLNGSSFDLQEAKAGLVMGGTETFDWTADVQNKKITSGIRRFGIDEGNCNAKFIIYKDTLRINLPLSGVLEGQAYQDVLVGTGDEANTTFELPSHNIRESTLDIKIDGVSVSNYVSKQKPFYVELELPPYSTVPRGRSVASNLDGSIVAIATDSSSPYVSVLELKDTWKARPTPPNLATKGYSVALSSDGTVLAVGSYTVAPYVKVYDWNGTNWLRDIVLH